MFIKKITTALIVSLALTACDSQKSNFRDDQSQRVTIYRDAWGVPHLYGETDGDAAFGLAYAQAEDNFTQLELNYISALGRSAELFGERTLLADWVLHSFEVVELSKRDYENASPNIKALLDGYAAGLNHYLAKNPDVKPKLLTSFEPWHPLALIRRMYYVGGFLGRLGFSTTDRQLAFEAINKMTIKSSQVELNTLDVLAQQGKGSNSWAANGNKIAGEGSYLFINPHLPAFGMGQVYEAHMLSDAGWNFTGYGRFGFPLPYVGFNENLGWASTDNYGDQEDAWIEHFGGSDDPLEYRYGEGFRKAKTWQGTIKVKDGDDRSVTFMKTHHGPVVAIQKGKYISARLATFDEPGWLDQWYNMGKAQNLAEFLEAVRPLKMQFGNYMYADREKNILFVYNGAFPKKDPQFNWLQPVDGSDPRTEWDGYHSMADIPQVLNPVTQYMQNTNTTPYLTSHSDSDPKEGDFPSYMVREGDNARRKNASRILQARETFDFEIWESESLDTTMQLWKTDQSIIINAYEITKTTNPERAARLEPVITLLRQWDGVATLTTVEPSLYTEWAESLFANRDNKTKEDPEKVMASLDEAVKRLINDWGDWRVPWGEINRSQRPKLDERGNPIFCDECPSLATPGVHSWSGGSQIAWNVRQKGLKKRYKTGGNSYTAIVDFPNNPDDPVKSKSIHVFGASANPTSPHNMDQAALLAAKKYKPAWLYLKDVIANAKKSYHPGEENK